MRLSIGSKSKTNCDSLGLASRQLHVFAWSFDLLRPLRFAGVITLVMVQYDTQLKTALLALWSGGWRVNGYCWLVNYEGRIWSLILAFDKPSIVIISFHLYPTPCFVQMNIWNIINLNYGERYEFMIDHRSYAHILSSCEIKSWTWTGLHLVFVLLDFCFVFICFIFFLSELLLAILSSASLRMRNSISSYLKRHWQ